MVLKHYYKNVFVILGALMKNVDLEGSHMAGVNLRVATLKNANLQNCDLRGAVLAGADLEVTCKQNLIGLMLFSGSLFSLSQ